MNIGEANAVNTLVVALVGPGRLKYYRRYPDQQEQQAAVDLLLKGAYKALGAGLTPGDATVPLTPRSLR